jgi:hypothetical protein
MNPVCIGLPTASPAACWYLTIRGACVNGQWSAGDYCTVHHMMITGGPSGTCVECRDVAWAVTVTTDVV